MSQCMRTVYMIANIANMQFSHSKMFIVYALLALDVSHLSEVKAAANVQPVILPGGCEYSCSSVPLQERNKAGQVISNAVSSAISSFVQEAIGILLLLPECGDGEWKRVAFLNMNISSQHCPSAWREVHVNGTRGCGRPSTQIASCSAVLFSPRSLGLQYRNVCGRVIGYEYGSADGFLNRWNNRTLDSAYVYGVSITHGTPRNHIWTYAAGLTEGRYFDKSVNCPCAHPTHPMNSAIPSFVGDNYYCESGNPGTWWQNDFLYNTDPLWDGEQCEGECCSNGKSPPWFSVELPNPTTDDIEVRICSLERTYQDAIVQLLEIYIQ